MAGPIQSNDPLFLKFDDWCMELSTCIDELWPLEYSIMPDVDTVSKAYREGLSPLEFASRLTLMLYPAVELIENLWPVTSTVDIELKKQIESTIVKWQLKKITIGNTNTHN